MKKILSYSLLSFFFLLSGCGGNGSSDHSNGEQPAPSVPESNAPSAPESNAPSVPESKVTLQVSTEVIQITSSAGDALPVNFEGTWSATNLGNNRVYVKVSDKTNNYISSITSEALEGESFTLDTFTNHTTPVGNVTFPISFIACKDSDCNDIYEDSEVTVNIQLSVDPVPEWQTHQANAFHNGYVPIWINAESFKKLWEWERGSSSESIGGINAPVAGNGEVYVSTDVYHGDAAVIALNELTGEENWRVSFGNMPALNPPAINSDTLFVSTSGHKDTKLWGINRAEGKLNFQAEFSSQWGHYLAPTVYEDLVFQTGGFYGGYTYAFSTVTGEQMWSQTPGASWGMDTPAVDDEHVYVHNGNALSVFQIDSGNLISTITDPFGNSDYDYHGSPVKGSGSNVLAFSGGGSSGRASSNAEHSQDRVISNFDIESNEYVWSSEFTYKTFFAVANGVVYAGKNNPVSLDAIDETTGKVLWSWVAPTTDDTSFHRNVVVTKNLLFVSTNAHLYTIDLESKELVWSYDEPGMIAISDNRILLLAPGFSESGGRLVAFDLRSN